MVFWTLTDTLVALQCLPVASSRSNCSNLSQVVFYRRKLAAWRARLNGYLLRRKLATEKAPEEIADTPLPRHPHLLLDGEVPVDEAASGRVPQPGPSRPDGSYTPHGLRDGYAPAHPIDLAAWKHQDYNHLPENQPITPEGECQTGKMLSGALLIAFVDFYVAIPAHVLMFAPLIIPGAQPLTPPAMKAVEFLDMAVVLPANLLGIKLIKDSKCLSK